MKFKRLLKKAEGLFSSSIHDEEVKKDSLRKVVAKLEKFEKKTKQKLADKPDRETREGLEKKLLVARAQRKKGLGLLKEMGD